MTDDPSTTESAPVFAEQHGEEGLARLLMRCDRGVPADGEDASWDSLGPFSRSHYRLMARRALIYLATEGPARPAAIHDAPRVTVEARP